MENIFQTDGDEPHRGLRGQVECLPEQLRKRNQSISIVVAWDSWDRNIPSLKCRSPKGCGDQDYLGLEKLCIHAEGSLGSLSLKGISTYVSYILSVHDLWATRYAISSRSVLFWQSSL